MEVTKDRIIDKGNSTSQSTLLVISKPALFNEITAQSLSIYNHIIPRRIIQGNWYGFFVAFYNLIC